MLHFHITVEPRQQPQSEASVKSARGDSVSGKVSNATFTSSCLHFSNSSMASFVHWIFLLSLFVAPFKYSCKMAKLCAAFS